MGIEQSIPRPTLRVPDLDPAQVVAARDDILGQPVPNMVTQFQVIRYIKATQPYLERHVTPGNMLDWNIGVAAGFVGNNLGSVYSGHLFTVGSVIALEALKRTSLPDYTRFTRHAQIMAFQHNLNAIDRTVSQADFSELNIEERFARYYHRNGSAPEDDTRTAQIYRGSVNVPMRLGVAWLMTSVARNIECTYESRTDPALSEYAKG